MRPDLAAVGCGSGLQVLLETQAESGFRSITSFFGSFDNRLIGLFEVPPRDLHAPVRHEPMGVIDMHRTNHIANEVRDIQPIFASSASVQGKAGLEVFNVHENHAAMMVEKVN